MQWVVVKKDKPKKRPVAKRTPVERPQQLTPIQTHVFDHLMATWPTHQTCDQLATAEFVREDVWVAVDELLLIGAVVERPRTGKDRYFTVEVA